MRANRQALALLAGALALGCARAPREQRPNIVLLIADDQDHEQLGFLGNPLVNTPNLDRLAAQGTVFTTAHTQPRCRPALACLLSGRWPHQSGIVSNRTSGTLDPRDSLPDLLRRAGYATFLGGKFWEGDSKAMGFEHPAVPSRDFVRSGQEELFEFIHEFAGEQPMFIWWGPTIPHMPHDPPERYLGLVDEQEIPLPDWFQGNAATYRGVERRSLAMVAWLDGALGELLDELRSAGALERTLFVFLIDNGWSNGLIAKGSPYEKGVRTPIVCAWPGEIPAGARSDELVLTLDVYPTLLDYAGVAIPPHAAGRSLRPRLEGRPREARQVLYGAVFGRGLQETGRPQEDLYALYARTASTKYVLYLRDVAAPAWDLMEVKPLFPLERRRGAEELFDLTRDPYELHDLSGDPARAAEMQALRDGALRWWQETGGGPLDLGGGGGGKPSGD